MSPTPSLVFFSDDLLTEFLSLLPVKSLLRFKCVRNDITVEQLVIVSLDLGTETYNQYLLPRDFSYSYKETDFVIWQMKKFGDNESWTRFLKISYHDLQLDYDFSGDTLKYHLRFVPLFLSKDGDTLILYSSQESGAIIYNWRDNRVQRTGVTVHKTIIDNGTNNYLRWGLAKVYVESCWRCVIHLGGSNKMLEILHRIEGERKIHKQDQLFYV